MSAPPTPVPSSAAARAPSDETPGRDRAFGVNFAWLARLRFGAVAGQLVVILVVSLQLHVELPLLALGSVLGLELAFNAWCWARVRARKPIGERHVTLAVSVDLLLFSALLYFSGGPANPFNFLYLIHIALAALVLPPRSSFMLVGSALGCSLLLFWFNVPLPHDHAHHMQEYGRHLQGMWVAFGLAACFIVYFIQRVQRELREIEERLALARERAARGEAVAALAMLSAGAAHELASPLGTIAIASGELLRRLPAEPAEQAAERSDLLLIRSEVERCRAILDQLAAEAGQARSSGFGQLTWHSILDKSLEGVERERVQVTPPDAEPATLTGSLSAVSQALRNLLRNALDASPPRAPVQVSVRQSAGELAFSVEDQGSGMSRELLSHATEPFFTTKPRGSGMGLGLFLAQSVAEQMGGRLELSSQAGQGTRAVLVLPLPATNRRMASPRARQQAAPSDV